MIEPCKFEAKALFSPMNIWKGLNLQAREKTIFGGFSTIKPGYISSTSELSLHDWSFDMQPEQGNLSWTSSQS